MFQHDQIYEIRHIRKYPNDELQAYYEKKRAFEEMLHKMDAEKNRVKQSKSTAQIEKRAQAYQAAVEQFDMSTNALIEHVETLKKGKVQCVADMYAFLDVHKKYHDELANIFAEIESKQ
ncbi:hypothetical protein WR25_11838 [Diploscapter pachys]|uniref:BAR domain-containing protein n=1 Tax=Diploscapter pachys TaxID=2018661 RepID=A0A2A2KRU9_9BILA|nr:hypothetical protein WR25_11838 [Diploscapter pachys]